MLDKELKEIGLEKFGAISGQVVIMDICGNADGDRRPARVEKGVSSTGSAILSSMQQIDAMNVQH